MEGIASLLDKLLPGILKAHGTWQLVSGLLLGWSLKHTVDNWTADEQQPQQPARRSRAHVAPPKEELKMVLCVNDSLKMGKGKIGAQCAHAACGVVQKYGRECEVLFHQWEYCGQAKIALKVLDVEEMMLLAQSACDEGLPFYIVQDAGRTQIPAGSHTVLAIGPAPKSVLDSITGHLKLL